MCDVRFLLINVYLRLFFAAGNMADHDHVTEDVSLNPIYGDMSYPDSLPLDSVQLPADKPTSLTMKSVTNPNYETTLEVGAQRERVASNPIYQTTAEFEGENPLYETSAGLEESVIYSANANPLYEAGPARSDYEGSGGMADLNPGYQSTASYHSHSDVNPLYEGTSDVSPLYESAAETAQEASRGLNKDKVDSRSKRKGRLHKEDELLVRDEMSTNLAGHDVGDGLGVFNRGADVTENELYGSANQPLSSPLESEPDVRPVLPRQFTKWF